MRQSRFTEEQIIAILAEQERGLKTAEVCRKHGISPNTFYKWKARYTQLVRQQSHADSAVRQAEGWLAENFREENAVAAVVKVCGIAERSLKRRFKTATGSTLIGYAQNLRVEEAKRLLESEPMSADDIAAAVGYENFAFFRRVFKRSTGMTPGQYRRMFRTFTATDSAS